MNPSSDLKPTITNRFLVSLMLIHPRGANLRPLKGRVTPRFVLENDYSLFFLIQGGSKSLKEAEGSGEMGRHGDEAQEEHL